MLSELGREDMSKWGIEEKETLRAIKKIGFHGNLLNMAAGDGRFNNTLLQFADKVIAIDFSEEELEILKRNCPNNFSNKLYTKKVDITKRLPFQEEEFDGIFCTGTLHLFDRKTIKKILMEIKRILKRDGKIILDFATDIERLDQYGKKVIFAKEGSYQKEDAILFFQKELNDFILDIEVASFCEECLESSAGYQSIKGNFLIIKGSKKQEDGCFLISIIKERFDD